MPIPLISEFVSHSSISLLTSDVKTRRLIGVGREIMGEGLKSISINPKILTRMFNATWDILLATADEAKALIGSILTTKSVRMPTEYLAQERQGRSSWGATSYSGGLSGSILLNMDVSEVVRTRSQGGALPRERSLCN